MNRGPMNRRPPASFHRWCNRKPRGVLMLFASWSEIGRILLVGSGAYLALVVLLRVSGKRTLTKLNAFDLVVTVALGSTLATVLLDRSISLSEGITALALLIALQFVITWSAVRWQPVRRGVKSEPTLLLHEGQPLERALKRQRVTAEELQAALRGAGLSHFEQAAAAVLETDGRISVIARR
jgi:uncharacterized membrane protein YcaP (DUF421 family)